MKLIRLYFKVFNLQFHNSSPTGNFLNFRFKKLNGAYELIPFSTLGYSNSVDQFSKLLTSQGYDGRKYTSKSFKCARVTALLDTGEPLANVQIAGRWRSESTPLHYRNTSTFFRLNIAKRIPMSFVPE